MSNTMLSSKSRVVTLDELRRLETPEATATHKPIPHAELMDRVLELLNDRGHTIVRAKYAVSGDDMKLFTMIELEEGREEVAVAIALRHSNDKSIALSGVAGTNCFICDNMALVGDYKVLSRKHTSGLDLDLVLPVAVDKLIQSFGEIYSQVERFKGTPLFDKYAENIIYQAIVAGKMGVPQKLLALVHREYFEQSSYPEFDKERNLWGLSNAFTHAIKSLTPVSRFQAMGKVNQFLEQFAIGRR